MAVRWHKQYLDGDRERCDLGGEVSFLKKAVERLWNLGNGVMFTDGTAVHSNLISQAATASSLNGLPQDAAQTRGQSILLPSALKMANSVTLPAASRSN